VRLLLLSQVFAVQAQNANGQAAQAVEIASILGNGGTVDAVEGVRDDGHDAWVTFKAVVAQNVDRYMK
jgi:inositol transport system substrate-binding protein